jgi:hypothetical protein
VHIVKLGLLSLALLSLLIPGATYAKKNKSKCGATGFGDCPVKGCGGDPELNKKKNSTSTPAAADVQKFTRSDFVKLKFPASWASGTPRTLLESWGESTPVEYEAYLIKTRHYPSGAESCNCNLTKEENNDFHLVTVSKKSAPEADSITAEITPHIRPSGWTFTKLTDLSDKKTYVKITGYLMLDTQHLGGGGPVRVTDWEIHPVTSMKVCTGSVTGCKQGSGWKDLADVPEP